jgi:hypothetical protein
MSKTSQTARTGGPRVPKTPRTPVREEAVRAQQSFEDDLDKLWIIIKKATPERAAEIMSQLDEKTITALRTKKNPYKKPIFKGNKNRVLAFHVINLTERYLQRFAMTSMIGFTYRMLDEYQPEESKKYPSENDALFGNPHVKKVNELKRNRPREIYTTRATEIAHRIAELRSSEGAGADVDAELRTLAKESFIVRAKLHKYELQLLQEERKKSKDKVKLLNAEIENIDLGIASAEKEIPKTQEHIKNKLAYDASIEKYKKDNAGEGGVPMDTHMREAIAKKLGFTLEQAESRSKPSYEQEIGNIKHAIMVKGDVAKLKRVESEELTLALKAVEANIAEQEKHMVDLKKEYSQKFRGATTSGPGAVAKVAKPGPGKKGASADSGSAVHPLDAVEPEPYVPTDEDIDAISKQVKSDLGIERTREEHTEYLQDIIQTFLDEYFVFNPDTHVQCAYKPNYEDPLRTPLEMDEHRQITEKEYERSLVPPDDTFFRWNRYTENNYEELRQATDDIYAEKSDFEFDIVPLEIFEGPNAKEEMEAFNRKYADEVEADILGSTFGQHNLMGSWAQNREKRDFYNENTEIIKRILDENEESQKFGRKLNKQRAEKKKAENIKETGPHATGFSDYKQSNPSQLLDHGATEAKDIRTEDIIPRDKGKPGEGEMEVGVTQIRPIRRRGGRRGFRGESEQWKFHISEEKMEPGQVKVNRPSGVHKKLIQEEQAKETAKINENF